MDLKILETSLNLRREKKNKPYILSKNVAEKQLSISSDIDIFANVEFMDCINNEYLDTFEKSGYKGYTCLDANGRGILCEIKNKYDVIKIFEMDDPHFMHLHIKELNLELIIVRILVSGSDNADFQDRQKQWKRVIKYINNLNDKSRVLITGDFNHGVIANNYKNRPRQYFNYQMIVNDLLKEEIRFFPIDGFSYKGYMKIDHIASGKEITIKEAEYKELYPEIDDVIGIPDHKCILANVNVLQIDENISFTSKEID